MLLLRCEICVLGRRIYAANTAVGRMNPNARECPIPEMERLIMEYSERSKQLITEHFDGNEQDPTFWVASVMSRIVR